MATNTEYMDRLTASASVPIALAYGRHVVAGNVILRDDQAGRSIIFIALGEGEWDSVEELLFNGVALDASKYHFHPGKDGETGTGGVSGDQKIDLWFPAGMTGLTFSRTAYIALNADDVIYAPSDDYSIIGVYKTRLVRSYDDLGVEQAFAFSANPAWCLLDALFLSGEPLTRIDYPSFDAAATYYDATLTIDSIMYPRFECHMAWPQQVDLGRVIEQMLAGCRSTLFDDGGLIHLRADQDTASVHTFSPANTAKGSFRHWNRDPSAATNRLRVEIRDLENDFRPNAVLVEREWHQELIGRVIEKKLDAGNSYQQQARRIGEYYTRRAVDGAAMVSLRGMQDAVVLLPGDPVNVEHTEAPWNGLKKFEVIEISEGAGEEREILLQEYDVLAFTDTSEPRQLVEDGVIVSPATVPAGSVTNLQASEDPFIQADGTVVSRVTFSFDRPSPLGTFAGVDVWIAELDGDGGTAQEERKLVTSVEDNASPSARRFDHQVTGTWLRIWAPSYNQGGRRNPVAPAPSVDVLLDGKQSAPTALANIWCQQIANGLRLSGDQPPEKDAAVVKVADTGSVTPAADGDITDAHVVGTVKGEPGSGTRWVFDLIEKRWIGDSDGTVITLNTDTAAVFFPAGAHVINGIGKKVTIIEEDGTETAHTVVSNTTRQITFPAASIPSGRVEFYLRDTDGVHKLYAAVVDTSGNQSTWKPAPPAVQACFPFAPDGSNDVGVPKIHTEPVPPFPFGGSWWKPIWMQNGVYDRGTVGKVVVFVAARGGLETETDPALALRQSINRITGIEVAISHSDDGVTNLVITVFPIDVFPDESDFFHRILTPVTDEFWKVNLGFFELELPGQGIPRITGVQLRVRNSYGWGPQKAALPAIGTGTVLFTSSGGIAKALVETVSAGNVHPNIAQSPGVKHTWTANFTLQRPELRGTGDTPGDGDAPPDGMRWSFRLITPAGGAGAFTFAKATTYKGMDGKGPEREGNRYAVWTFRVDGTDDILESYTTGDV